MLPTTVSKGRTPTRANPVFPQYLRRIVKLDGLDGVWVDYAAALGSSEGKESQWADGLPIDAGCVLAIKKWQQMDIEYTFWQMLHLCTSPKVVYQHTKYHKQTKNQWARDDPAFIVICSLLLAVSTLAYCAAYDHSAGHAVFVVLSVTCFHFLLIGALLATCCWFLTNTYLREEAPNSHVVEQRVEWLYAFDVHCNSFFPLFVMLYVLHYFLSPLLVAHGFIPTLLSNLLFMTAASYYHYLNFLGYDVLPFLERTTFFLYPIGIVIILSPIFTLSGFNPSRYFMNIYFSQWS